MENHGQENKFEYTYSAPTESEKQQIESIRRNYAPADQSSAEWKYARLRALDAKVKKTAVAVSLVLGVVGTLIFGLGLTMILEWFNLWGIAPMLVGVVPVVLAYPAYGWCLNRGKAKYGEEILRLSEELLNK